MIAKVKQPLQLESPQPISTIDKGSSKKKIAAANDQPIKQENIESIPVKVEPEIQKSETTLPNNLSIDTSGMEPISFDDFKFDIKSIPIEPVRYCFKYFQYEII